jgi:hypothetical protein
MGLIGKILHKDKHQDEHPATANFSNNTTASQDKSYYTGPQTNTSSSAGHTGHGATTGSHGLGSNTTSSGLGGSSGVHTSNTTAGPHSSNTGNKVDPRVDSDNSRYNSNTVGGQHGSVSDNYGHRNEYNSTSGPHASNMANRADPRVDSDNSRYTSGVSGSHGQFADTSSSGHRGYDNTPGAFPTSGTSHGHSSGLSSQPHVDRDGYGSSTGTGQNFSGRDPYPGTSSNTRDAYNSSHASGAYGSTGPASNTLGPHSSNAANVADPQVHPEPEKMREHKTAGPHNSDMLNKLDPRVDSDRSNQGFNREHEHNDHQRYGSTDSGRQTGGFVGGPHERLENRGSIPTAGGLPVGADGNGPYSGSHGRDQYDSHQSGLTGSHGGSHGGLTGSHGRDQYESSSGGLAGSHGGSHGGLTGNHGRDQYESSHGGLTGSHGHANEPYGASDRFGAGAGSPGMGSGAGFGSGSHHTGGHGTLSDLEYKEREIALRQKELDLKEREYRINAGH